MANTIQMRVFREAYEMELKRCPEKNIIGTKQVGETKLFIRENRGADAFD